jgi:frataxin
MMDESTYLALADKTLESIARAIEEQDSAGRLDVELNQGILTLELDDGRQFVINRHTASRQVWMSSPISGASHHAYVSDQQSWVDSEGRELLSLLEADLLKAAGVKVTL